ncbi:hypothetical protein Nmel_001887 [Mimus melanotis]
MPRSFSLLLPPPLTNVMWSAGSGRCQWRGLCLSPSSRRIAEPAANPSRAEPGVRCGAVRCRAEPARGCAAAAPLRPAPASRQRARQAAYCRQPGRPRYPGAGGEGLKQWEVIEVGDICVVKRLVGVKYMLTIGERGPSRAACLLFLSFARFYWVDI